ncbi:Histone deacetylase HOS3 [Cyphellophora attinorum]|uniref:Histone deacetylase HOS3 n=1 Tax=Cyphellophora attinorum TaxID=1664694 RepID=A0A0N0NMY4_9EURO|nr:Histone deacetylase HOS3 [Phialophora attinorum]KPI40991.1 Histone deacetylase HOS3 [Phialophora attinorum]
MDSDPDVPLPSIEGDGASKPAHSTTITGRPSITNTSIAPPVTPKSKSLSRSPPKLQTSPAASRPSTARSPSVASAKSDRQPSPAPALRARQSLNNLKSSRSGTPQMAQFRRASSNLNPLSPVSGQKHGTMQTAQHKALTPNEVAKSFFAKEIDQQVAQTSEVVVIVHDSCYGHRFSRPKATKAALSSIVERPERIQATLLGASLAYVRLGGRHADGRYPPHPKNTTPAHSAPFHINKTNRYVPLNHAAVTAVHGAKWMEELQIMCDTAEAKLAMNGKELVRPIGYGKDENGKSLPKLHEGDLYLCSESLAALQGCLGGVCEAVDTVFAGKITKRAFVCIRPPGHHCSADFPSGFCWLNNVHVGIKYAAMTHGLTHAAIIDFDLHHGDGSQMIAWDHNTKAKEMPKGATSHKTTPIGYYSLHDINSYPCEWGDEEKVRNASVCVENAHGLSIWNVHLEEWKDHAEFWKLYETRYLVLLEKTRKFLRHHAAAMRSKGIQPKAAIFVSAGFDASEWEMAGMQRHGVSVPTEFYARFTSDIVKISMEEGTGVDGRIISVLEGGYSDRALASGVLSHVCGLVNEPVTDISGAGARGLGASMSGLTLESVRDSTSALGPHVDKCESSWWSPHALETIEAIVAGRLPPSKEVIDKSPGNYSSPTQASNAKMTRTARERQSLNAELEARLSLLERPPPPPPDVEWEIAAYELSQLIIPGDRQISSCRHDELNAEATKARRARQSGVGIEHAEPMQLRDRKSKAPALPAAAIRSTSRTRSESRRTTIASFADLPDPDEPVPPLPAQVIPRPRRRSSAGSSIVSGFSDMKLTDEFKQPAVSVKSSPRKVAATANAAKGSKGTATRRTHTVATKPPAPTKVLPRKAVPALSRQTSNSSDKASTILQQTSSNQSRQASTNSDASADMDNITSGLKKIKLKMPTKEQHDQNQRKLEEQMQQKAKPKPARKIPVPRAKATSAASSVPADHATVPSSGVLVPPTTNDHALPGNGPEVGANEAEASTHESIGPSRTAPSPVMTQSAVPEAPTATSTGTNVNEQAPVVGHDTFLVMPPPPPPTHGNVSFSQPSGEHSAPANTFATPKMPQEQHPGTVRVDDAMIHHQHSHPAPAFVPASNQWRFVTPNTGQPGSANVSRPMTPQKYQLPTFTSTSPIPFAKTQTTGLPENNARQEHSGIWDIPDTPR